MEKQQITTALLLLQISESGDGARRGLRDSEKEKRRSEVKMKYKQNHP